MQAATRSKPVDQIGNPIAGAVPVPGCVSGGTVTWYLGTTTPTDALYYQKVGLPPASRGSFQFYLTVAASVADNTRVCNAATVAADVGTEELLGNNTSQSCVVVRRADVAVRKKGRELLTGDPDFAEFGGLVRFTIDYNNIGSISAQDVVIDEIVPTGTSLVSVNPPPGSTVTYSPNQANATSFSVHFNTLTAPANSVHNAVSSAAADNTRPTLVSVLTDCSQNKLTLNFSEAMDLNRATTLANYQISLNSNNVAIQNIQLSADGLTVLLFISPLASSNNYVLRVNNLTDIAGNFIASNTTRTVRCPTPPVITTQPSNQTVEENQVATFTSWPQAVPRFSTSGPGTAWRFPAPRMPR
jgi:uncharacterized repeat protein (TIGR01451 family)